MKTRIRSTLVAVSMIFCFLQSISGQFTLIMPPPAPHPEFNLSFSQEMMDFSDPVHGFFSAELFYSPSSGSDYWLYFTADGGNSWNSLSAYSGEYITNRILHAVDSNTSVISFVWSNYFEKMYRESINPEESFLIIDPPGDFDELIDVSSCTDGLIYLTMNRACENIFCNRIFRLEGNVLTEIMRSGSDTLLLLKTYYITPDTGFIITKNNLNETYSVNRTTDGGQSIVSFLTVGFQITDIDFFNNSTGMICGENGMLYKTTDAGETWEAVNSGITKMISCLDFINDQAGYLAGDEGTFYLTTDQGESWSMIIPPSGSNIIDISMFDIGLGYVHYKNGISYKYQANLGIDPIQSEPLQLFPNPATSYLNIEIPHHGPETCSISLKNCTGQSLLEQISTENHAVLDLRQFPPGLYILMVTDEKNCWINKVIIR